MVIHEENVHDQIIQAQARYLSLFAFSPSPLVTVNTDGFIIEANAAFYKLLNDIKPQHILSAHENLFDYFLEEDLPSLQMLTRSNEAQNLSLRLKSNTQSQGSRWVKIQSTPHRHEDQSQSLIALTDINQETDELFHKETLLRELNHRIKNSLGLILSILQLESIRGSKQVDLFSITSRIHALSKVYDRLFTVKNNSEILIDDYLGEIFTSLVLGFCGKAPQLKTELDVAHLSIDSKRAMSLGLIITELVSNALRYGFPQGCEGSIGLRVDAENGEVSARVENGGGFILPPDFTFEGLSGTGLQIVGHLTTQLRGRLSFESGETTKFFVKFPL